MIKFLVKSIGTLLRSVFPAQSTPIHIDSANSVDVCKPKVSPLSFLLVQTGISKIMLTITSMHVGSAFYAKTTMEVNFAC